jgi:Escherichia/Staphylococcus phage prohead protease
VKAAITEGTEQGTFTAIAAAYSVGRVGDRIIKGAFEDTIRRWQAAGRDVPLVWDHGRDARDVIGTVFSSSLEERDTGLYVEGQLDLEDSAVAREAWRSVKRGRVSLSFGYLTEAEREGPDGVKELTRLDLMEVTLTSVPANPDAKILSTKNVDLPPELIGTSLDPAFSGEIPTKAQIDAEMKAIKAARPIQIASFEC